MDNVIYKQDAIDVVHKAIFDFFDICDDDEESPMTYKDEQLLELNKAITTQIKAVPSAQPEQRWIPCSERLPAEGESVLLCDRYEDMTLGRLVRTDEGYKWDIYAWWNDIDDWNAWMPLPEPYKDGEQDG